MARTRARLIWAVLLAFALRALIPLGFMPAGDGTLSLMICPAGLPAGLLPGMRESMPMSGGAHMPQPRHQGHGLVSDAYCAFTTGFSSAPPPLLCATLLLLLALATIITARVLAPPGIRRAHLPPARAPPAPR